MDLLAKGTKKLSNRKRAVPAKIIAKPTRPEIQEKKKLATPVFGGDVNLQREFSTAIDQDDTLGIQVTREEREIISSKSLRQRRNLPTFEPISISYTVISSEEIDQIAVFEVKNTETSGLFSINDVRGGTIEENLLCATCNQDNLTCPGHFGKIVLNRHIIHPLFRKEVIQILQSVCNSCGGLLLTRDYIQEKGFLNLEGPERLKAIAEESIKIPCRRVVREGQEEQEEGIIPCISNPTYRTTKLKETGKVFYTRDEKGKTIDNTRSIDEIEAILDSISKEDAEILGFSNESHPRRFIMKSILVIPPCSKPPVFADGLKQNDDLDSMYLDIVRNNNELARKDLNEADEEKKVAALTFSIEHLMNNSDKKYKQGKTKVYQSLKDRIQGKEALIREALMGKRVNYSARTVLGPDPTLRFGQIRVPRLMAPYLTQHEVVSPENINKMMSLLRAGKITYLTRVSGKLQGRRIKVTPKIQKEQTLMLGDEVERWLENGDWVIFNRQPTLHKQGFMGYEVVLGNARTFGLHLGYTPQHNAD